LDIKEKGSKTAMLLEDKDILPKALEKASVKDS
jgi:hypothetical protein